jgi:GH24 family phage-related lysozyme (muramidase)
MRTSIEGLKFICRREACVLVAHEDGKHPNGQPKYALGFGSQDPPPQPGDTITIDEAFERLQCNLDARDEIMSKALIPISQLHWDAVSSLFYQAGSAPLKHVASLFNAGTPGQAIWAFTSWPHGEDRKWTEGHAKRRMREMSIAWDGYYGDISTFLLFDGPPRGPDKVPGVMVPFPADLTR